MQGGGKHLAMGERGPLELKRAELPVIRNHRGSELTVKAGENAWCQENAGGRLSLKKQRCLVSETVGLFGCNRSKRIL